MKAVAARITRGLNIGSNLLASDNSGARIVRITGVKHGKSRKGRQQTARVGDYVKVSVQAGKPDMIGIVFDAIVIRQRKSYRRLTGEHVMFEDNAVALMKDDKGNPKGTQIKGVMAREAADRWSVAAKIAQFVL
ncbi:MAG TPA: uL14 family ribosomal protein [Candidatus Nanoarchaeia archaeon]|nr:50S ribosomal protein L14P [uncultured archaeon]HLC54842.1 uL14 family ribosomal protein [Candidatus Nanoarchaeia archaeon]